MDSLLATYSDSDNETSSNASIVLKKSVNIAPDVNMRGMVKLYENPLSKKVFHNPDFDALWAPTEGPQHSFKSSMQSGETGYAEAYHVDQYTFQEQLNSYNRNSSTESAREMKKKRKKFGNAADEGFKGPWAGYDDEENQEEEANDTENNQNQTPVVAQPSKAATSDSSNQPNAEEETPETKRTKNMFSARSIFHGDTFKDYLGRTFVDHPSDLKPTEHECYLPKKRIHQWNGHAGGVSAIRFFPKYGHLLLSSGMDSQVKIWDVHNKRQLMRSYLGHTKAVRDICFSNDGRRFLSASYDRTVNLWDTETGECLGSYSNGKMPYCIKMNPDANKQHIFLAGCNDKRIYQWDTNSGKIVQTYDQHLGPVNTITFVDENRRFVTTSDDKSIRVWDWNIPVVIKYISEPHMHSIPAVTVTPDGNWFAGQSLDNQILVYSTKDKFRINKKKSFSGHVVSGFACQIGFSPDGHWIMSGDADGRLWFWDWNNTRVLKTIQAHKGVCIGAQWHPIETSKVATCGWDGFINYWD